MKFMLFELPGEFVLQYVVYIIIAQAWYIQHHWESIINVHMANYLFFINTYNQSWDLGFPNFTF